MLGPNTPALPLPDSQPLGAEAIEACIEVLEAICADRTLLAHLDQEQQNRLMMAAGRVSRPERHEQRALSRAVQRKERRETRDADRAVLAHAGIRQKRLDPIYVTPDRPPSIDGGGDAYQAG